MRKESRTIAAWTLAAAIGVAAIAPAAASAAAPNSSPKAISISERMDAAVQLAVNQLKERGVLNGYDNGTVRPNQQVTQAEAAKLIVLALNLKPAVASEAKLANAHNGKWYAPFAMTAIDNGLFTAADFAPNKAVSEQVLAAWVAKTVQRDALSARGWMQAISDGTDAATRGEAARLLVKAEASIRSDDARILSVKALDAIALEITTTGPMSLNDEAIERSAETFQFDGGLTIVNQPRLKTGSTNTYIVPVTTMEDGKRYTLTYKGDQKLAFSGSGERIRFEEARQVTNDTFEVEALLANGVVDYGYVISAYADGRGTNAIVLEEGNALNGKTMQIISSLRNRTAVLTPAGGEPMTVSYVGFTQSTDGKQEPKFRLPAGQKLVPGLTYKVSADWFETKNASFVAGSVEPLQLASAQAMDSKTLAVTLASDPGDELFAFRSVKLTGNDGSELTAQYRVQTRKGATGAFDLQNGGALKAGVTYKLAPIGDWAVGKSDITISGI
ncbi:S-layer homology domain-containing protein [Cohnella sp. OV330]|uniref:S-layer homology domain-containing protein n=1 Tax=Cohnella sp. OV330 TaxID=1855288 RepID=UPI0008EBF73C|nr:S-layer homology domain-containing protein [Cohnella sp. OV330]SFB62345.1 S-layer homology domain-containing protein [Cohnella sp. OV330]